MKDGCLQAGMLATCTSCSVMHVAAPGVCVRGLTVDASVVTSLEGVRYFRELTSDTELVCRLYTSEVASNDSWMLFTGRIWPNWPNMCVVPCTEVLQLAILGSAYSPAALCCTCRAGSSLMQTPGSARGRSAAQCVVHLLGSSALTHEPHGLHGRAEVAIFRSISPP